jgi:micrococcal nuclease
MYEYKAMVMKVVDGDTYDVMIDLGFDVRYKARLRLYGYDAPEVRGEEREQGLIMAAFVREAILGKMVTIKTYKDAKEKWGRYLADVILEDGTSLKTLLEGFHF